MMDRRKASIGAMIALVAGALSVLGCNRSSKDAPVSARQVIAPAEFARPGVPIPSGPTVPDPLIARATVTGPVAAMQGMDIVAAPEEPTLVPDAAPVGSPAFIDAKIGDVNGKPVFASAFFDRGTATSPPLGPRLAAEAKAMERREWLAFAQSQISQTLQGFVVDELLEAEARSKLTEEQRQGLRFFVEKLKNDLVSENRGSRSLAEESLGGRSVTDYQREQEQTLLIRRTLSTLDERVVVSPRDIELEYERRPDLYDPPSIAKFRLISVDAADEQAVERVNSMLASGTPFGDVADDDINSFSALQSRGRESRNFRGSFAEATFFELEPVNDAARSLSKGAWAGPIRVQSAPNRASFYWVALDDLVEERRTLADNQLVIYNALLAQRSRRERERYISRLAERASFTSTEDMTNRLMAIAVQRYLTGS